MDYFFPHFSSALCTVMMYAYMWSQPNDGTEGRFLVPINGSIGWWEIRIFEKLTPVAAQPFDMLIIRLLESTLQAPIHCPVSNMKIIKKKLLSFYRENNT